MLIEHEGKSQKWESFASGRAIAERFGKQAAEIDDQNSWVTIAHDLSIGLYNLIAIAQPEIVIFGGGVGTHFEKFGSLLEQELKKYEDSVVPIPPLQRAQRPEEAVIYGCYELARSLDAAAVS